MKKRGAFELSMTTVVILVIAMVMLALGLVMVRRIMCGAIGLTSTINTKIQDKINRMFETETGEVQCLGAGTETIYLIPGKINYIYCGINSEEGGEYSINIEEISGQTRRGTDITGKLEEWKISEGWKGDVIPGKTKIAKILALNIPKDAPEGHVRIEIKIVYPGGGSETEYLDFEIKRIGGLQGTIC